MTEAEFWEGRYRTQHKTVHRLEDEIERLRTGIKRIADLADDTSTEFFNGYVADELLKLIGAVVA